MKRKFGFGRGFTAFALSLVIALSASICFAAPTAFAFENEFEHYIEYNKVLYDQNSEACHRIASGIRNLEDQIYIGDFNLSAEKTTYLVKTVLRKHPELFYVDPSRCGIGKDGNGNVAVIAPIYKESKEVINKQREEFDRVTKEIAARAEQYETQFERAAYLHDEIILNSKYYDNGASGYISAYETLINHRGNCQGYSEAYAYLLSLMQIRSEIVESSAMYHIWIKVCIDGSYYNVDLTWDDPSPDKQGHAGHKYFLLSDEAIMKGDSQISDHYGFDYVYYKSTNKKYDNYLYHEVNSRFCFTNNTCYMVDNTYKSNYEKTLLKYDFKKDNAEVVRKFDYKWRSSGLSVWKGGYMSLEQNGNYLYFNSADKIFVFDIKNNGFEQFSDVNSLQSCYGLRIIDGVVYASVSDNPNLEGTLIKVGECKKETAIVLGDVNGDGIADIRDATEIQKAIAGIIPMNSQKSAVMDIDGNGKVNIKDATALQKILSYY